jgi:hypothetical protein
MAETKVHAFDRQKTSRNAVRRYLPRHGHTALRVPAYYDLFLLTVSMSDVAEFFYSPKLPWQLRVE